MHAKIIIAKFGGQTPLATKLGKGQSTVAYWAKTGVIPAKWQPILLQLAVREGVTLQAEDFVYASEQAQGIEPMDASAVDPSAGNERTVAPQEVEDADSAPFLFYTSGDGAVKVRVVVDAETVWATQRGLGEIFGVTQSTISHHLKQVFDSRELDEVAVYRKFELTAFDGKQYETSFYNLDAIISVGYRVNSYQATQFRKWATTVLRGYLIKGFALDDDRLKQGKTLFGKDYFDELLEKIREIRASERRFYQKITDIYSQCSVDYDKNSPISQQFYAHVQDKLHYAIHGHTSAEIVVTRADADKPNMGLSAWKNERSGGKITKSDVAVGKNYLTSHELDELNRLVSQYLDFAEGFARRKKTLTMQDWAEKLDGFLEFNAYAVLKDFGKTKRETADRKAFQEYEKFRIIQDKEYKSDFDEVATTIKINSRLPRA
ncbi:virulence RhuM family protein [soil metagenome]